MSASSVPATDAIAASIGMAEIPDRELILSSGLFDPIFYLYYYRDVAAAGVDPVVHYLGQGAKEDRRPNPFFDGLWYLRKNPDVAQAGLNPLVHYLRHGLREGRRGHKRCVVYTAITRQYDYLRSPVVVDPELDYIVFADDQLPETPHPWIRVPLSEQHGAGSLAARFYKTHPHVFLPGYEISAWVDGAFQLRSLSAEVMEAVSRAGPIAFFPHPGRRCANDEAKAVIALGRDSPENVDALVARLEAHGFPRHAGLVATGFVIRDHHDNRVVQAMAQWWDIIRDRSRRDQLSINFVLWKQGLQHVVLPGDLYHNEWAFFMGHRPATLAEARDRLVLLEGDLLRLQTTLDLVRDSSQGRLERKLRLAGERQSDKGDWNQGSA
jgi:hypothetical protein